ncbi:GGDEF domain-containing protein, partial [Bacillus thuringiensis]|uniref:GGDEF domain-containing protein n=1 Tax=Bacillus thuringiensis TaxID=1428 RepID=UPI0021B44B40
MYNPLNFQQILHLQSQKLIPTHDKIPIILFDIHNFKTLNHTYPHHFPHLPLIQLPQLIKSKVHQQ